MISIIAAIGKNNELGKDNKLIWNLPSDLKFFKNITINHPVIMGKNTFKSIGKPLKDRINIVLNDNDEDLSEGIIICKSLEDALFLCEGKEAFIIGGASLYNQTINMADNIYLTEIDETFDADVYFPNFDKNLYDKVILDMGIDNNLNYSHVLYRRKNGKVNRN